MTASTVFQLPRDLLATEPPEARGVARDGVRLLVASAQRIQHAYFRDIGGFLTPGDLLVVNTSATLPAAVDGRRSHGPIVVHFSTELDDGSWVVELRSAPDGATPIGDARTGERIALPSGARLTLRHQITDGRLWAATVDGTPVRALLARHGRPIRYGYVRQAWPLSAYQTVFATHPGSAEMPSAGRPFTPELVTRLLNNGVRFAPIVLHTGVSSLERHERPQPERFQVPPATAELVTWTRRTGGRVIAVGTTVVRALESAATPDGEVKAASAWTDLVLGPDDPVRVVDGLITGLHAPDASHLLLLEAVAGPTLVQRAYEAALAARYLWHEFGDVTLLLPQQAARGTGMRGPFVRTYRTRGPLIPTGSAGTVDPAPVRPACRSPYPL
jgi:S-adenosylmethionine:tRNA ribosyltransferase-isomerase